MLLFFRIQFSDFDINPRLQQQLEQLGYKSPFEIQSATLKHTLQGRYVCEKNLHSYVNFRDIHSVIFGEVAIFL